MELCRTVETTMSDVDGAVQSAKHAQKLWGRLSGMQRASKLHRAAQIVRVKEIMYYVFKIRLKHACI